MRSLDFVFAAVAGLVLSQLSGPALAQTTPIIAESDEFVVLCQGGAICATPPSMNAADRDAEAQAIAKKGDRIVNWFRDMGFGAPDIDPDPASGKFRILLGADSLCPPTSVACFKPATRRIYLPETRFANFEISPENDAVAGDAFAHEISHAFNLSQIGPSDPLWLGEAMGDAFGRAWIGRGNPPDEIGYVMSLDAPFHSGADGGYEKAPYLEMVGRKLGSADLVAYLKEFFDLKKDGASGMTYLYQRVGDARFDRVFPEFVARYNSIDNSFPGPEFDYYDVIATEVIPIPDPTAPFTKTFKQNVEPFAAEPTHVHTINPDAPAGKKPSELLMAGEFSLTEAARMADLQLIHEHERRPDRRNRYLFVADKPHEGGFVRVSNAGPSPSATAAQSYTLAFNAWPVEFQMPECVTVGQTVDIQVDGDIADVDNWILTAQKGSFAHLKYTAPETAGTDKIKLEIISQITRQPGTLAPVSPAVRKIDAGEIEVRDAVCDIKMEFVGRGISMIYKGAEDYTVYLLQQNMRIYIAPARLAAYMPQNGGWMPIPPAARAMMLSQFQTYTNVPAAANTPPWADPDMLAIQRMPRVFSEWYDWKGVTTYLFGDVPEDQIGERVDCPLGGRNCVRIDYEGPEGAAVMIYDAQRRIEQLSVSDGSILFRYGAFQVERPPGW